MAEAKQLINELINKQLDGLVGEAVGKAIVVGLRWQFMSW